MGKGISNQTHLSLRGDEWKDSQRELLRWGNGLPFGAVGFHYYHNANQNIAGATRSAVSLNTKIDDLEGWGSSVTNQFKCPKGLSGEYVFNGGIYLSAAKAAVSVSIVVNGLAIGQNSAGPADDHWFISAQGKVEEGQLVELACFNVAAGLITLITFGGSNNTPVSPFLRARRISLL